MRRVFIRSARSVILNSNVMYSNTRGYREHLSTCIRCSPVLQHSMVLIRRLKLEACCDHLSVNKYQEFSAAERRFTGEPTPRALETGDYGVALFHIESSVVNVTFVSDSSVNNDGFELLVFPFYRTFRTVSPIRSVQHTQNIMR